MGSQSARMYFQGYDHSGVAMVGKVSGKLYNHAKMYKGNNLLWERMPASIVAVKNNSGPYLTDEGSYISTANDLENFSAIQYGISVTDISDRYIRYPKITQMITFAGYYVCIYNYINTLENKTSNLVLKSKDGYVWEIVSNFLTSTISWIGKHIIDGEEYLCIIDTGIPGTTTSNIVAYYFDSKFTRKKYESLANVVRNFSVSVYGYDTLFVYYQRTSSLYKYKIVIKNGKKVSEERIEYVFGSDTKEVKFYNYSDDCLYSYVLGGTENAASVILYKLGDADKAVNTWIYDLGVPRTGAFLMHCYSTKDYFVMQIKNDYKESSVFIKIQNNNLSDRVELPYIHIYTSNGVSIVKNYGSVYDYDCFMTDNIFSGEFKLIKVKGLDEWYNNEAKNFELFAYLQREGR